MRRRRAPLASWGQSTVDRSLERLELREVAVPCAACVDWTITVPAGDATTPLLCPTCEAPQGSERAA